MRKLSLSKNQCTGAPNMDCGKLHCSSVIQPCIFQHDQKVHDRQGSIASAGDKRGLPGGG